MATNDMIMVLTLLALGYGLIYRKNKIIGSVIIMIIGIGTLTMTSLNPIFPIMLIFITIINLIYMLFGKENPLASQSQLTTGMYRRR